MGFWSRLFGGHGQDPTKETTPQPSKDLGATSPTVEHRQRPLSELLDGLKDKNKRVRQATVDELTKIGGVHAVEAIVTALADEDLDVQRAAAFALGKLRDPVAVIPLASLLNGGRWEDRSREAAHYNNWKGATLWEKYAHDLGAAALWALQQLGELAIGPLLHALQSTDIGNRRAATEALGRLGNGRAVEPLIRTLEDPDGALRARAAWALGQLGDPLAVPALVRALDDSYAKRVEGVDHGEYHMTLPVQSAAVEALERIGGPDSQRALADTRGRRAVRKSE